jgi:hypothetical protein
MAFDLAMNALFAGLRAGFTPEEIRKLKAHWKSEDRREIGRKSEPRRKAKSQEWRARASDLAKAIWAKNNTLSQEDLADKIIHNWGRNPGCPGRRSLVKLISRLQKIGELPQGAGKLRK